MFTLAKSKFQVSGLAVALLAAPLCAPAAALMAGISAERSPVHGHAAPAMQLPSPRIAVMNAERRVLRLEGNHPAEFFRAPEDRVQLSYAAAGESETRVAFPIRWQNLPVPVSPELVHVVKHFRHEGLPLVRLWQSGRNLLHVGLNGHGTPGIWFVQRSPD